MIVCTIQAEGVTVSYFDLLRLDQNHTCTEKNQYGMPQNAILERIRRFVRRKVLNICFPYPDLTIRGYGKYSYVSYKYTSRTKYFDQRAIYNKEFLC